MPGRRVPGEGRDEDGDAVHFWRRHVRDTVIILEEGNLPHPRCETVTCLCRGGPLMVATRAQ